MPTAKDILDYPVEYGESFIKACREPVIIPCNSKDEAALLRARLYAFRNSVFASPYTLPKVTLLASLIEFRIVGESLIINKKDSMEDRISDALRKSTRAQVPAFPRQHDDNNEQNMSAEVLS